MEPIMCKKMIEDKIAEFAKCVVDGMNSWVRAGELIVEILEQDPSAVERICESVPGLPKEAIYRFEAIGRRTVHPRLLLSAAPGIRKLVTMPYSVQELHIENPIPVMVEKDGNFNTLQVMASNLTPEQCKQVFAGNHIRDMAEQRAWLETERKIANIRNEESEEATYSIIGGKVHFRRACTISKRDLANILMAMK